MKDAYKDCYGGEMKGEGRGPPAVGGWDL